MIEESPLSASNPEARPITPLDLSDDDYYGTILRMRASSRARTSSMASSVAQSSSCQLVAIVVVVALILIALIVLGIQEHTFQTFMEWALLHRVAASVIIILLYVPMAFLFLPLDVPLYLCAGFMYGIVGGSIICWIGYNLGAWFGFFASRHILRDWLEDVTRGNRYMEALEAAIHDTPITIVLLLQVAPIASFSAICYFFGTSVCPFKDYAIGTAVGVIPCVIFFVFMGSSMESLATALSGNMAHDHVYWYFFIFSGVVGIGAVVFIGLAARHQLDRIIDLDKRRAREDSGSTEESSMLELGPYSDLRAV